MTDREIELLLTCMAALKDACRASHKDGPGGAALCICGAECGGSAACGALRTIRDVIAVAKVPKAYRERLEELRLNL